MECIFVVILFFVSCSEVVTVIASLRDFINKNRLRNIPALVLDWILDRRGWVLKVCMRADENTLKQRLTTMFHISV